MIKTGVQLDGLRRQGDNRNLTYAKRKEGMETNE